jgi:hypothetical protein
MALSKEQRRALCTLFREDLDRALPAEQIVKKCGEVLGDESWLFEVLAQKLRRERAGEISRSQGLWFQALGWWFAKLFMWTSLFAALIGVLAFGRASADPLTWGMLGAIVYYVAIQVATPWRLSQQEKSLRILDEQTVRQIHEILAKNETR